MTTGWMITNIVLAALVSTLVAGVAVLVPLRLDRDARPLETSAAWIDSDGGTTSLSGATVDATLAT